MGMGRHQKSGASGVSARWVFVLCISSFFLGLLVVNRLLATSKTVDGIERASTEQDDQARSLHPLIDCESKEEEILSRVSHTHAVIKTLDKTISSLEVELAAARAARSNSRDGSPAVAIPFADVSKERPRMFFVMGIMTAFSSSKRRDSIRGTWLPKGDELKRLETDNSSSVSSYGFAGDFSFVTSLSLSFIIFPLSGGATEVSTLSSNKRLIVPTLILFLDPPSPKFSTINLAFDLDFDGLPLKGPLTIFFFGLKASLPSPSLLLALGLFPFFLLSLRQDQNAVDPHSSIPSKVRSPRPWQMSRDCCSR